MSDEFVFQLSDSQELLWVHERLSPVNRAYNFVAILTLRGLLREEALSTGPKDILRRSAGA